MTTQITVRLPDHMVCEVDRRVSSGDATSRAELVSQALSRELRRRRSLEDLERLAPADADHDALLEWMRARSIPSPD